MKKLIRIVIVLVIVLVLALVATAFFLGSIVKKGIETAGPQVAKVEVKLDSASLSVLSGSGTLKGLLVGNPKGFDSPSAIRAAEISLGVKPASVFSDKIVVKYVRVIAPEITLFGLKGDNLRKIEENIQASAGGPAGTTAKEKEAKGPGKKIQVDDFLIKDGTVKLVLPLGAGIPPVKLPEIHLTNLGNDSAGLTAADLSAKLLKTILDGAISAASGAGVDAAKALQGASKETVKELDKTVKGVGDLLKKK